MAVNASTVQPILALLGDPVAGNPTQYMVEQALLHHRLDWRYLSLEVSADYLPDAIRGMRAMGFHGGNCTEPHKSSVIQFLDRSTPVAELTRVVNCFYQQDQRLIGDNTEGRGFLQALKRRIDPAGRRVLILGAGRMARAIGVELALAKVGEITVVARREEAARELAELLTHRLGISASAAAWNGHYAIAADTDVVAAAIAQAPETIDEPLPLALDGLSEKTIVADATFNPPQTWLLREAAARKAQTIDGLEMFIDQAALNFHIWTGIDPDLDVLREAVEEFLEL
jgi:shikimate dehydrogenase